MGIEKHGSKGGASYVGGFLQLFDWNGRSRKKLLYNKFDLPESTKQGKRSDENLPSTRFRLVEEEENGIVSSGKGSGEYSCVSSSTDDEGNVTKAPGVVARLMGLDTLPTTSVAEPYSTPYFDLQSFRDASYQRKTPEFQSGYQNVIPSSQPNRVDGFSRRTVESRLHKMPNSPIERFQCETLPPKSAKSHPIIHHKLLSPIKSHGFFPPKNAADIMEAAARILEPGYQVGTKGKSVSLGSSSVPIKVRDLKENVTVSKRPSRLPEPSRRPSESNAAKYLKGQSLNKSWNGSDDTPSIRASPNSEENHPLGSKNKGKSISLAIQAKVNVQKREGLSSNNKGFSILNEEDEYKSNQSLKSQPTSTKNRQSKLSTSSASAVLRQNNQKQNCLANKDKTKPSVSNQQGSRFSSGDGSFGRSKTFSNRSGSSRVAKKEVTEVADKERDSLPRTKNLPRKKRSTNGDLNFDKNGHINTVLVDRDQKSIQSHVAINEHLKWAEDSRRKGTDVVSFTFTSPMIKPTTVPQSTSQTLGKQNTTNICFVDSHGEKTVTDAKGRLSSLGLNVIGGDALSILLEQKLRELTSGVESFSCFSSAKAGMITSSTMQDFASALNTNAISREFDNKFLARDEKDESSSGFDSSFSSTNGQVPKMNHMLLGAEGMVDYSSSNDVQKELDCQHRSPVSVFEASFSNESCHSSESCESTYGGKLCSSIKAQNIVSIKCPKKMPYVEAEAELSDSASSTVIGTVERREYTVGTSGWGQVRADKQEVEYVSEILRNTAMTFKDLALGDAHGIVHPRLFDRLEDGKCASRNEGKGNNRKLRWKELFDCVSEFVDMKCSRYTRCGYKTWSQGVAAVCKEGLAEEIYKDILLWRSMGDWMVDELVEKDMSIRMGRWVDFEVEAFEIGVEIEVEILCSLVDELVADIF